MSKSSVAVPPGFTRPDLAAPLDVDDVIARIPKTIRIRGMFLQGIVEMCARRDRPIARGPYVLFKEYSVEEHVQLLATAAEALHPGMSRRHAFTLLGRNAYVTMTETLIGRVVFGVLGRDILRITRLVGKAYEISGSGVSATLIEMGHDWSRVRIDGPVGLIDSYHVGAFEGVVEACGLAGDVFVKLDATGGELFTRWWNPG